MKFVVSLRHILKVFCVYQRGLKRFEKVKSGCFFNLEILYFISKYQAVECFVVLRGLRINRNYKQDVAFRVKQAIL
jgi:hypothetical protein